MSFAVYIYSHGQWYKIEPDGSIVKVTEDHIRQLTETGNAQ